MISNLEIRNQFPALKRKINGKEIVYFDNAASTLKPQSVIDSISKYYSNNGTNIHRGIHLLSEESTSLFESARSCVAKLINANHDEIIFVRNTTEAINLVRHSLNPKKMKKVVTTLSEHHSNLLPWISTGNFEIVNVNSVGLLDPEELKNKINESVGLVAVNHISNVTGIVNPIKEIIKLAHGFGSYVLIDAAQSISHRKIDVKELDCDFLVFSGHKMFGPTGIGVLYVKKELYDEIQPFFLGGGMVNRVSINNYIIEDPPWCFEAGTPNVSGAIGLNEAINFISNIQLENIKLQDKKLTSLLFELLSRVNKISLFPDFSADVDKVSIITFKVNGFNQDDIAAILSNRFNIMLRSGIHCAEPFLRHYNIKSLIRISAHVYNNEDEIEYFVDALKKIINCISNKSRQLI